MLQEIRLEPLAQLPGYRVRVGGVLVGFVHLPNLHEGERAYIAESRHASGVVHVATFGEAISYVLSKAGQEVR